MVATVEAVHRRRRRGQTRRGTHDSDVDDGLDQHEQADEEEQRAPLDVSERLVRVQGADDHQDGRTQECDRRCFNADHGMEEEADQGQAQHD